MYKRLNNFDYLLDVTKHMMPLENIFVLRKELFQTSKHHKKMPNWNGFKIKLSEPYIF